MTLPELSTPEDAGFASERLARIDGLMERYVEEKKLAGTLSLVYRKNQLVHLSAQGYRDREAQAPMTVDTLFRIYSMTKPITSVAALMLFEEGHFLLNDPIASILPEFEDMQVCVGSGPDGMLLEPARRPPSIQDLMRHTAGLSYGWHFDSPVEEIYRQKRKEQQPSSLAEFVKNLAQLPLLYHPGERWRYSFSTDVLARIVEVVSGLEVDRFFSERIFQPLQMTETHFQVQEAQRERLSAVYSPFDEPDFVTSSAPQDPDAPSKVIERPSESPFLKPPPMLAGGHGLISTAGDYLRFCRMLLDQGELEGERLLGRKTVELMTSNHLPRAIMPIGIGSHRDHGYGFGLGVSHLADVAASAAPGSQGTFGWGGAAGTIFFIDPVEEMIGIFMTQIMPTDYYPVRRQFRIGVYQALVD